MASTVLTLSNLQTEEQTCVHVRCNSPPLPPPPILPPLIFAPLSPLSPLLLLLLSHSFFTCYMLSVLPLLCLLFHLPSVCCCCCECMPVAWFIYSCPIFCWIFGFAFLTPWYSLHILTLYLRVCLMYVYIYMSTCLKTELKKSINNNNNKTCIHVCLMLVHHSVSKQII